MHSLPVRRLRPLPRAGKPRDVGHFFGNGLRRGVYLTRVGSTRYAWDMPGLGLSPALRCCALGCHHGALPRTPIVTHCICTSV